MKERKRTMNHWIHQAVFYHIYPLGFCGAPKYNEEIEPVNRFEKLIEWIPHLKMLGINVVYLGPVFESSRHGYDTKDYYTIDKRLGTNESFQEICRQLHQNGIRIVLDGVFNHVGREFWAFKDVQEKRENSHYCSWFHNLNFGGGSPMGDPFWYEAWNGCFDLVKLNLRNPEVVEHLLNAVGKWIDDFGIDGLRLDAADCVDMDFFRTLKHFTTSKKSDFWLMGEIIHGDYNRWANPEMLDSTTNYECYKGLYSSHNDKNYFEIAHSLNRQFGNGGIYQNIYTYNFVDNHDVDRLASHLNDKKHLQNVYTILYTMPGAPSLYYGSEWGIEGKRTRDDDSPLRPCLELTEMQGKNPALVSHLFRLSQIRQYFPAIQYGKFENVQIKNEQLIFKRYTDGQVIYIVLNLADHEETMELYANCAMLMDLLRDGTAFKNDGGKFQLAIPANSAMVLLETQDIFQWHSPKESPVEKLELSDEQKWRLGRYRHFKGNDYLVIDFARHSETQEWYVVYQQLYGDGSTWIRPADMFYEIVERDGIQQPRFRYIGEE